MKEVKGKKKKKGFWVKDFPKQISNNSGRDQSFQQQPI